MRQSNPGALDQWFATHPTEEQRIQATQSLINQTVPRTTMARLTTNTTAFNNFKARMARYPAPPAQYRAQ